MNENLKWLSFHGGFDFGYMLKLLTNSSLPHSFDEFNEILRIYFPNLYDLKFQIQDFDSFRYDGLSRLANGMKVIKFFLNRFLNFFSFRYNASVLLIKQGVIVS